MTQIKKRLVYADDLRNHKFNSPDWHNAYAIGWNNAIDAIIDNAPTVDATEVMHGKWIWGESNHLEWMKCSECLKSQTPNLCFTYCPNCGAKMDGGSSNE